MTALKSRITLAAIALCLMTGITGAAHANEPKSSLKEHGPIAWTDSLQKAQKLAAKTNKIIFVDFYADWCGPCQQMLHSTYKHKGVVARSKDFIPVLINVDKQPELAAKYGVEGIPDVTFINPKGKVLWKSVGYSSPGIFLQMLDQIQKKYGAAKKTASR